MHLTKPLRIKMTKETIDLKEFCERLGISLDTGRRMVKAGQITAHKIGSRIKIFEYDYEAMKKETRIAKEDGE